MGLRRWPGWRRRVARLLAAWLVILAILAAFLGMARGPDRSRLGKTMNDLQE